MSWRLEKMSASVLPVLKVTSHAFAQAAMAERLREREMAMEARSLTEQMAATGCCRQQIRCVICDNIEEVVDEHEEKEGGQNIALWNTSSESTER